ncbi:DUF7522 family protein [Halorientalis pallida]|uniref:Uncharacterized protein n=1 Tax=Halorientalis pallida TaxID=2479928 RepID=A0A498KQ87_9EURY|nr:hypothetical protein [Halorientalis pallida]RXK46336.1 hypothetical protein EAF64_19860 [Halorientalis pallida]
MTLSERVWSELRGRYGGALRTVIRYHPTDFEAQMRADLRARYSDDDIRSFVDEVIVNYLNLRTQPGAAELGEFHGTVRTFDDVWVFSWPDRPDEKTDFLITLDRDDSVGIEAATEIEAFLTDEIAPQL